MKLINNTTSINDSTTTENSLKTVMMAMPQMKSEMVEAYGSSYQFPLVQRTIGLGRTYLPTNGRENVSVQKGMQEKASDTIYWSVMSNLVNTFTVMAYGTGLAGSVYNNTAYTMSLDVSWVAPGMNIGVPTAGGEQQFNVQSAGVFNSGTGYWDYSVKFFADNTSTTVLAPLFGYTTTQGVVIGGFSADCDTNGIVTPKQFPDVYVNTTTIDFKREPICRSGISVLTWFELSNGEKCWTPLEEHQQWIAFLRGMELKMWRGVTTYQSISSTNYSAVNTPLLTDANGNHLKGCQGILNQIPASNKFALSLASITQQVNDAATLDLLTNKITDWKIRTGFIEGELYLYTGVKGKALLNRILKGFADLAGGGVSVTMNNMETGKDVSYEYNSYSVCGVKLVIVETSVFDNPEYNTDYTAAGSGIPKASYQMVMMPDKTFEGTPLLEVYFKGGCGVAGGVHKYYQKGRVDPDAPGMRPADGEVTTWSDGYESGIDAEWTILLNNPLLALFGYITA